MRARVRSGVGPRPLAFAVIAALAGALVVAPIATPSATAANPPLTGSVVVDESFTGATLTDPAWVGLGSTCLTGAAPGSTPSPTVNNCDSAQDGPVPTIGASPDGYLQLTDTSRYASGTLLYNRALTASAGISIEFEQYQYGGNGADGIGFFIVDGSTNLTQSGGVGGSLGYAQRYSTDGILGGYIGVGLDTFGNFYGDGENKGANCPVGQRSPSTRTGSVAPNVVTLRGPGSGTNGYCYQASTTDPSSNPDKPTSTLAGTLRAPSGTTNPTNAKRLVNVQITPGASPRVIVQINFGSGWDEVLNEPAPANMPSTVKFGFAGSTGGVTDVHLLRNVVVRTILPLASLQISKQVDREAAPLPAVITAGTEIHYQFVVTNAGVGMVHSLTVVDPMVSGVTCAATTLYPAPDPRASTVCRGVHSVTPTEAANGVVTNSAFATGLDPANAPITSVPDTVTVPLLSQLTLAKAVTTAPPYVVGQSVSYSYTVTNTGGSTVTNIVVSDNRAAGNKVICDRTTLGPTEIAHCTLTTTVRADYLSAGGSLLNTAQASGVTTLGQSVTSLQAQASIQVGTDIQVTKTVSNASPLVGQNVTFVVTATNVTLNSSATGIVINDLLPTGMTLVSATPTVGAYTSATGNWTIPNLPHSSPPATLTVVAQAVTARVITNAATLLSVDQPDTNPANNTASVSLNPIVPTTDIAVNIFVDSPSIRVGGTATFTISATNNGPQPATGVSVTNTLPSRLQFVSTSGYGTYTAATSIWDVGNLAVGQTVSVTVEVKATAVGSFQNTAGLATVSPQDVNQSNDLDSANLTVTAAVADLQLVKSIVSGTENVHVGDYVTYVVTVTNAGPDTVPDVVVAETHVAGLTIQTQDFIAGNPSQGSVNPTDLLWSVGLLAPGDSATIAVRVKVDTPGTKVNVATVSSATVNDPDQSNNTDIASLSTGPAELDLAVTKTLAGAAQVTVGDPVTFVVTVRNNGATEATDVELFDPLPAGLNVTSVVPLDGVYDSVSGIWSLPSLPAGDSSTLTITATTVDARLITNTASVQSLTQSDTNSTNDSASASVDVVTRADLGITKTVSSPIAQPGETVTYTVIVTNNGPNTAENVQAVDPIKIDAIITGSTISHGSFDVATRVWDIGTLTLHESATLTVSVEITRTGTFLNTVVISQSSVPDPDLANNRAQAAIEIPSADLNVAIAANDTSPSVGQQVTITISANNRGPDPTTSALVAALLPAGLSYVGSVASAGSYDETTGVWNVGVLDVNEPAETLIITATVTGSGSAATAAQISSTFPFDPEQSNNSASVNFAVAGGGLLSSTGTTALPPLIISVLLLALGVVLLRRSRRPSLLT